MLLKVALKLYIFDGALQIKIIISKALWRYWHMLTGTLMLLMNTDTGLRPGDVGILVESFSHILQKTGKY